MLLCVSLVLGVGIAVLALVFLRPISLLLGAEGALLDNCVLYGRFLLPALPFFILQNEFQSFLVTAEKPGLGLAVTAAAGVANIVLDALFVAIFRWGLVGAALATAASQVIGGLIPLVYFLRPNPSPLRLVKTRLLPVALRHACLNGSSEFVTNISMSVVSMLYNLQLIKLAGENGVAAYGVVMYVSFLFIAVFLGYSIGSAPVISYHYGADHQEELRSLFQKSLVIVTVLSVSLTILAEVLAKPLSVLFVGYDPILLEMTTRAFVLYSFSYLLTGFNIFGSAFFTALNDGLTSAAISFLRTLVFQTAVVLLLPALLPEHLKLDGIWLSILVAEGLALCVTTCFILKKRNIYGYA
jgi:Na+-driven multidrug efflux pump